MTTRTSGARAFQENLLQRLTEVGEITTIYLRNRMSLRGRILKFDPYVLLLEPLDGSPATLVYKSAVVSISGPRRPMGPGRRPMGPGGPGGPGPRGFRPPRPDGPPRPPRPEGRFGGPPRPHFAPPQRPPDGGYPPRTDGTSES